MSMFSAKSLDFAWSLVREAIVLLVCAATLGAGLLWAFPYKERLRTDEISPSTNWSQKIGLVWIDARSHEHYDRGHISKALLLNEEEWNKQIDSVVAECDNASEVIVYCSKGCRTSYKIAEKLKEQGVVVPVHVLKGGYEAWQQAQKSVN